MQNAHFPWKLVGLSVTFPFSFFPIIYYLCMETTIVEKLWKKLWKNCVKMRKNIQFWDPAYRGGGQGCLSEPLPDFYLKIPKVCDPILVTILKIHLHNSQSSPKNAILSWCTSPLAGDTRPYLSLVTVSHWIPSSGHNFTSGGGGVCCFTLKFGWLPTMVLKIMWSLPKSSVPQPPAVNNDPSLRWKKDN